jgi:hypothetical protein
MVAVVAVLAAGQIPPVLMEVRVVVVVAHQQLASEGMEIPQLPHHLKEI